MLWFNDKNNVKISFIRFNDNGIASASAGIGNKKQDGTMEYFNINVRFMKEASKKLHDILKPGQERITITVLNGGVDFYNSGKYKDDRGKGLTFASLTVIDFEEKVWDNSRSNRSAPQPAVAPVPQPPKAEDDNPFGI